MAMLTGLLCVALLGADLSDAAKKELETLQGKWQVERIDSTANVYDRTTHEQSLVLEFKGAKLLVNDNEAAEVVAIFTDTSPRCLDLKRYASGDGLADEAIFKLEGEQLVICIFIGGGTRERPASFDKPNRDGVLLVTMTKR
jgi:uncharacterized protein (TIGR03067 family)